MRAKICGLVATHGFHIHEFGDLTGDTIVSNVGNHFNPFSALHGYPIAIMEHHVGDLGMQTHFDTYKCVGNLTVDTDGTTDMETTLDNVWLSSNNSIIGKVLLNCNAL